jgi:hypothetical protein
MLAIQGNWKTMARGGPWGDPLKVTDSLLLSFTGAGIDDAPLPPGWARFGGLIQWVVFEPLADVHAEAGTSAILGLYDDNTRRLWFSEEPEWAETTLTMRHYTGYVVAIGDHVGGLAGTHGELLLDVPAGSHPRLHPAGADPRLHPSAPSLDPYIGGWYATNQDPYATHLDPYPDDPLRP